MLQPNSLKRILYVENGIGYGGAIICLRHLVRNLDRNQFLPMVITGRVGPQYREIASEALWKHIPDRLIDIAALQDRLTKQSWPDKLPGLRFACRQVLARLDDIANFLPFFIALLWTAWRFKADLIHANNEPLCNRAALLVAKCLGIPAVCHVRGEQKGSRLMRWSYELPDHFISVSTWIADSMRQNVGVANDKISVVYDGIALDQLDTRADGNVFRIRHGITDNDFAVGLVGLLIPWKGQHLFIDAAKYLSEQIPHLKMLIIGGTPDECVTYEHALKQRVLEEGLSNLIVFTGHVNEMQAVYNGLDVVVSASTSPEPLGTVVIESMAMGRPLVAPDHGGAREMISHNQTGLLFTPGHAKSLADAIQSLSQSPDLRQSLGDAARRHALETFAVETHTQAIEKIYHQLLY